MLPQFASETHIDWARVRSGLELILWGLFKKVVIADRVAIYVDTIFAKVDVHDPASLVIAGYLFSVQIYCDFSAYSDIAIGSARVLGYDLIKNFDRPFFSRSITEFWRRWHISLSSWLRDYLYIALAATAAVRRAPTQTSRSRCS